MTLHDTTEEAVRVMAVGDGFLIGVHKDVYGVETIRRHRIDLEERGG